MVEKETAMDLWRQKEIELVNKWYFQEVEKVMSVARHNTSILFVIENMLRTFNTKDAAYVRLRYGLYEIKADNQNDLSVLLGVTEERVRQIAQKVERKFLHGSRKKTFLKLIKELERL